MIAQVEVVDQIWWYMSRASGVVAWSLLSLSVLAGVMQSTRLSRNLPAGWTLDLHRFLSMLSILFLAIHLAALVPDNFVHFGWLELFVPYGSEWRPGAVALGVVAFWLLVCVEATSLIRSHLPVRLWRTVHLLSFVVWVLATAHLLTAGTDVREPWFRIAQALFGALVIAVVGARIVGLRRRARLRALAIEESVHVDEVDTREGRELSTRRG
ncbi:MAG: ferric reductase-like transmembrane domain-containing protein [Acidimicrobiales bacterium]